MLLAVLHVQLNAVGSVGHQDKQTSLKTSFDELLTKETEN
jgi:hypothetical protein